MWAGKNNGPKNVDTGNILILLSKFGTHDKMLLTELCLFLSLLSDTTQNYLLFVETTHNWLVLPSSIINQKKYSIGLPTSVSGGGTVLIGFPFSEWLYVVLRRKKILISKTTILILGRWRHEVKTQYMQFNDFACSLDYMRHCLRKWKR